MRVALERIEVTLSSWLSYAEQRVPDLYKDVARGKVLEDVARGKVLDDLRAPVAGTKVVVKSKGEVVRLNNEDDVPAGATIRKPDSFQHPVLFDFLRKRNDVLLYESDIGRINPRRLGEACLCVLPANLATTRLSLPNR